jgi:hypothetical protein
MAIFFIEMKRADTMFDKIDMRHIIALVWLICFILLWVIFAKVLPYKIMSNDLTSLEQSIKNKNWEQANKKMRGLKSTHDKYRKIIQMNNATEIYTTFELTFGQLESTVENRQESAIEYVGALKESLKLVSKAFSGP